ncbi:SpoIID/LytB domain-containing protein [Lyngbya sp. PCC 8106]|uniref:SpoIID/LytB domain-containing protein n=1 Tax=Lyngbya sp. (strain PCC 8106) TaxID=313612 RepID=UPI0000EAAB1F|nr:SpoIID/LytB domain-containing protein [Lyngbya sp. PCC 8106]EAW33636.1 sporulation protein SpoIID-like protein [Lyngbya sp. PCC 8106]
MKAGLFLTGLFMSPLQQIKPIKHWGWVCLLFWLLMVAPAQAAVLLRVAVTEEADQVKVGSSTPAVVRNANGQTLGQISPQGGLVAKPNSGNISLGEWKGSQLWVEPTGNGHVWIGEGWYRGRVLLVPDDGGITAVNYVDLEQYLYSVLGAEMDGGWPLEALKAQAVAARTYALYKRERSNGVYDLGDDQMWQVYKGLATESGGTQAAVNSTAGQVLTHNGQIILAAFHSSSGGHTENVEDVWDNALPYLRGVPDYDKGSPVFEWTRTFSQADLSGRISGVGKVVSMTPEQTTAFGSILSMKVVGEGGTRTMTGEAIAAALGLRSTRFRVNRQPNSTNFTIVGRGFGHGVGLSQWGAYNLARAGYTYYQILMHYYQNTSLAKIRVQ